MSDPLSRLADILGPELAVSEPSRLAPYSVDGWQPSLAIYPSCPEEAALLLRAASEKGVAVVPWGSGTKRGLGPSPGWAGAVLCTGGLANILDHDPENLTVTVGAGITLSSLQEAVRATGQRVTLDPPHAERATVGGILAANSSGPRRLLYGAPRDLALGLRAALPDGRLIKAGGKTVKNVAGYDLTKLFIGSLGTLGVIVEVTLKLRPLPGEERTLVLSFTSLEQAGEAVQRVMGSPEYMPAALELMDAAAAAVVAASTGLALGPGPVLAVALEGFAEEVEGQAARLAALAPAALVEDGADLWKLLANGLRPGVVARVGVPASRVVPFMEAAGRAASLLGLGSPVLAQAGTGIVRLFLRSEGDDSARLVRFLKGVRSQATGMGGYLVLEEASPQVKAAVGVWGEPGPALAAMERIKAVFDPRGVLNPGRFVGGI